MINEEKIIRRVTPIGNGAHIFAPREWLGEEIVIVRPLKKPLNERILEIIKPYLEDIRGAYLYGSQARGEASSDSDIDLLLITNKKMSIKKLNYEILCLQEEDIHGAIKINPVLIYSALSEAKPIINSALLYKLKKEYKPKLSKFKEFLKETNRVIRINEELLSTYSIILRLRGLYIIDKLIKKQPYTNKAFESWIIEKCTGIKLKELMSNYKRRKMNLPEKDVQEKDIRMILGLLKNKLNELMHKL